MITDIGQHKVHLPINNKDYNFREAQEIKIPQPCETKLVIGPFEFPSQIWLGFKLSDYKLSYYKLSNYKLSDYKLSNYRFPDQLVWNTEVYGPIKFEEIAIFMIHY